MWGVPGLLMLGMHLRISVEQQTQTMARLGNMATCQLPRISFMWKAGALVSHCGLVVLVSVRLGITAALGAEMFYSPRVTVILLLDSLHTEYLKSTVLACWAYRICVHAFSSHMPLSDYQYVIRTGQNQIFSLRRKNTQPYIPERMFTILMRPWGPGRGAGTAAIATCDGSCL